MIIAKWVTPERAFDAAVSAMQGGFEWGGADCCFSACAAFETLWGINPMASVPPYGTACGAARYVRQQGGALHCVQQHLQAAGLRRCFALPGVLAFAQTPCVGGWDWALGLCLGDGSVALKGDGEVIMRKTKAIYWGLAWD